MEAWLICKEHWTPVAQLPILVIQQVGFEVLRQKNGDTYGNVGDPVQIQVSFDGVEAEEGYHVRATAVEIILHSNSLVTDKHTEALVEVHLQCSGSLLPAVKCHLPDAVVLTSSGSS